MSEAMKSIAPIQEDIIESQGINRIRRIVSNRPIKVCAAVLSDRVPAEPSPERRVVGAVEGQIQAAGGVEIVPGVAEIHIERSADLCSSAVWIVLIASLDCARAVCQFANRAQV